MVEQRVLIPCVAGSSPASPANSKSEILFFYTGKVAEWLRQRIANPSSGNRCAGSIPALSSKLHLHGSSVDRAPASEAGGQAFDSLS